MTYWQISQKSVIFLTLCKWAATTNESADCGTLMTPLGYLSAVSVNTPFTEKKWGLGLSYWHQWLNTTETLTNSLPNEKQVSFTCEHLFLERPSLAVCNSTDCPPRPWLQCYVQCAHGHHCSLTVQTALPIHWRQQMNEFRVQSSSLHHWTTTTRCKSGIDWVRSCKWIAEVCCRCRQRVLCCKQEALLSHTDSLMLHPGPPEAMLTIPAWHILNKWKASA